MKETIFTLFAILAVTTAGVVINIEGQDTPHLLGAKACTWGPSYWCQNLTTAAGCKATKHCISNVWEKMQPVEDKDSVCQICKDMVQQARDQLESNQTQEDLKAVFEGSCDLMYIKPIVKECDRLVDQFIPELIETLASQMNPSVVCSVAGLCNSAHIDRLIEEYGKDQPQKKKSFGVTALANDEYSPDECTKCYTIAHHMEYKFKDSSRDNVLERFLNICGQFSSFSDACSSIVITHFETIYSHLQNNFNAKNVCHLSGQCVDKFHVHEDDDDMTPDVEIRPLSSVGMVDIGDDLPCKLCEQLVAHLRDLLVANTTESEFQLVLEGLCKQTKSFANECKAIVDEYYPEIYSYLTKSLNGKCVCEMGGLCPAPGKKASPIWPLVSESHAKMAVRILEAKDASAESLESENLQLPLERMSLPLLSIALVDNTHCPSCEFTMNHIKNNVRNLDDEKEVRSVLQALRSTLPSIKSGSEENFLTKYEEAVAELIREKKDLSEICALVAVCQSKKQIEAWKNIPTVSDPDYPECPLCKMVLHKLYDLIEDKSSEASIEKALNVLCSKLHNQAMASKCINLVKIYTKEIIPLILNDLSPEEVCNSLKLCPATGSKIVAVPQDNVEGKQACAICEYILHYIQQAITDPKVEENVKTIIEKMCKKLPSSIENECDEFVNTYGDAVVAVLAQQIDPSQVCPMIHLCPSDLLLESWKQIPKDFTQKKSVEEKPNCPLCLLGVTQLYNVIKDNKTEASIEAALDKLCIHLPKSLVDECETLVTNYSKQIIKMVLEDFTPQQVCVYLELCDSSKDSEPTISFFPLDKNGEIMSNEIPSGPMYTVVDAQVEGNAECEVCEFIVQHIEKYMSTKKSKEELEALFHGVCKHLPKHMSDNCNKFVNDYADIVIELLLQEVSPKEICSVIDLCKSETTDIRESVSGCAICQTIVENSQKIIYKQKSDENLEHVINNICDTILETQKDQCKQMVSYHGKNIAEGMASTNDAGKICKKLDLCSSNNFSIKISQN